MPTSAWSQNLCTVSLIKRVDCRCRCSPTPPECFRDRRGRRGQGRHGLRQRKHTSLNAMVGKQLVCCACFEITFYKSLSAEQESAEQGADGWVPWRHGCSPSPGGVLSKYWGCAPQDPTSLSRIVEAVEVKEVKDYESETTLSEGSRWKATCVLHLDAC